MTKTFGDFVRLTQDGTVATVTLDRGDGRNAMSLKVMQAMIDAGMPAERVSASAYADTRPVASNEAPEGRAANRRIEIVVVPDLTQMPGFEALEGLNDPGL